MRDEYRKNHSDGIRKRRVIKVCKVETKPTPPTIPYNIKINQKFKQDNNKKYEIPLFGLGSIIK